MCETPFKWTTGNPASLSYLCKFCVVARGTHIMIDDHSFRLKVSLELVVPCGVVVTPFTKACFSLQAGVQSLDIALSIAFWSLFSKRPESFKITSGGTCCLVGAHTLVPLTRLYEKQSAEMPRTAKAKSHLNGQLSIRLEGLPDLL